MINEQQRKMIEGFVKGLLEAKDLLDRYSSGFTNKTADEVNAVMKAAKTEFNTFINEITEPQMSIDKFSEQDASRRITTDNSFELKPTTQVFELSVSEVQKVFGKELCVPYGRVTVEVKTRVVNAGLPESQHLFDGLKITVKSA